MAHRRHPVQPAPDGPNKAMIRCHSVAPKVSLVSILQWKSARSGAIAPVLLALLLGQAALAQVSQPPVNLGNTNFVDGRALPGIMFQQTWIGAQADSFRDASGDRQAAPDQLKAYSVASQLAWLSDTRIFGANWGAEFILPLARVELDLNPIVADTRMGFGDLFVSPLVLQWPERELFGRPYWQRLNVNVILPVGDYDPDRLVNLGSNAYRINPHYAFSWFATDEWELSGRVHFLWNGRNRNPATALQADSIQPGRAVHTNLAVSRELAPGLRLGLSGYHLRQISDDRIDGMEIAGSREQVIGYGPGLRKQRGPQVFFFHVYRESAVRNRPQRHQVIFRYARFY
ncbi:MAG: phenol degradation protein [Wenzhouxiangella sp.]|nr:MAG: phenol degradation protein [Wenzhouxiangella sp.]